jgi:uncharacterized protein YlxW (UPF0749 family)
MKAIEGLNLKDLVTSVSEKMLDDRRKTAEGIIRKLLERQEQLSNDIKKLEKELNKKNESLDKGSETIEKIRMGNWDLINDEVQNG